MKTLLIRSLLFLGLGLGFTGCNSVSPQIDRTKSLKGIQHFFVISNLNDNHAIDRSIVSALIARGKDAASGPLTMMPDNSQAVITYSDHWSWDFGEHLMYLTIEAHQANSQHGYASITFQVRVPLRKSPGDIIADLVDQLLADAKK
jgi:hypothetical protein